MDIKNIVMFCGLCSKQDSQNEFQLDYYRFNTNIYHFRAVHLYKSSRDPLSIYNTRNMQTAE
jgi:hypothetical protein